LNIEDGMQVLRWQA